LEVTRIETGRLKENCYVVSCGSDAVLIDPGGDFDRIVAHVAAAGVAPRAVLTTHAHYDHIAAAAPVVEEYGIPFHLHPADRDLLRRANLYGAFFLDDELIRIPAIDVELADGMELGFGGLAVRVLHTPGHSPGSVCLEIEGELFTGDTLMASHLGRTDLAGGDRAALDASIALLAERFSGATTVRPGHGDPASLGAILPALATMPELRG
jgi:glyoxylase-like metal-dependent hydrolase (beta-lactamase superfamily II)